MPETTFHLYDITNTTRLAILGSVVTAEEIEELLGVHTLELTVDAKNARREQQAGSYPEDDHLDDIALLQAQKYIRVYYGHDGSYRSFIIRKVQKLKGEDEFLFSVHCEAKKYALLDQVVNKAAEYSQLSAADFLTIVFADVSGFSVGTNQVPSTELRDVVLAKPTIQEALAYLHRTWTTLSGSTLYRYYPTVTEAGVVNIMREDNIGSTIEMPQSFNHSIKRIAKSDEAPINRVYCSGLGNDVKYSDNQKIQSASAGSYLYYGGGSETYYLYDGNPANTDRVAFDSYISLLLMFMATWSGAPVGSFTIEATVTVKNSVGATLYTRVFDCQDILAPNVYSLEWLDIYIGDLEDVQRITLECTNYTVSGGGAITSPYVRNLGHWYELAPNDPYVEDAASQSTYGIVSHSAQNNKHPKVINEIRNYKLDGGSAYTHIDASLSGTYGAGLATIFTAIGANTFAENTNPLYIIHGSKSQRVTNLTAAGVHLSSNCNVRLIGGVSYVFLINLYVVSGSLKIAIYDNYTYAFGSMIFEATTQGAGWIQLVSDTPFGPDETCFCDLVITTESKVADYYIDSFQIARSTEEVPFYLENSADALLDEANRILYRNKDQHTSYEVDINDLARIGVDYREFGFDVGDTIWLLDSAANLSDTLRVYRRESDLLDPRRTRLLLSDRMTNLTDIISLISQNRTLRGIA